MKQLFKPGDREEAETDCRTTFVKITGIKEGWEI